MKDEGVKRLRLELGLSQERFARLLEVSLQTVRRWEEGVTRPLPVLSLRLEELRRQLKEARYGPGGIPMRDRGRRPGEGRESGLGGLFKGVGSFLDLLSQMTEEGKEEYTRTGEVEALGGKAKAVYGFSVRVGLGGRPVIEQFGNIRATEEGPVVAEVREPLVDVLDEGDRVVIIAELPGVEAEDIQVQVRGDILELTAETRDRKYYKEVLLPTPVDAGSLQFSCRNGILEIKLAKG